jgi:signal transduction histidine kinase
MENTLETIRALNQQSADLHPKDAAEALRLAQQAQSLLATCPEAQLSDEFECLKNQGSCLDDLSRPEEALPLALRAEALAKVMEDHRRLIVAHALLGMIYWHIDEYPTAMDYYLNGLKLAQAGDYPDLEARVTNGLGLVLYGVGNYTEALGYFQKYLRLAHDTSALDRAHANNNIAYVLHMLGRDAEALDYGLAALEFCEQAGTATALMETLHSAGAIYLALGREDQALEHLRRGLSVAREFGSSLLQISYILEIGRLRLRRGELAEAEQEALDILQIAERINSITNLSLIDERLVEIYTRKQDWASAMKYFEAYHETYKKIFNDKSDRRVKQLEVLHQVETAKRDAEIYRLRSVELSAANQQLAERGAQLEAALGEVRRLNTDLEQRVDDRTADLALAKDAAEAASRAKTAFLSIMGHELRTPLNGIFLAAEVLRGDKDRLADHGDLPDHILNAGRQLLGMVEGVLEYANAEGPLPAAALDVKFALHDAAVAFERRAAKRGVTLAFRPGADLPSARCDEMRFAGVMRRLLENAIRFAPEGGQVTVTAEAAPWKLPGGEGPAVVIRVTDTGVGLKAEDRERVFEPFVQLESSYLVHSQGVGLGLTLARRQAEACGGRLWAESPGPGSGSTFTLVLPAAEPEAT